MKKICLSLFGLFLATAVLSGCQNTWHGAGQDVQNAGAHVQNMGEKMEDPNR